MGLSKELSVDRLAALVFVCIACSTVLVAALELYWRQKEWFCDKAGDYGRIALCHGAACVAAVAFGFLPPFARPVLLLSIGISVASTPFFGMMAGVFHIAVYGICGQDSIFVLLCQLLLLAAGSMASYAFKEREGRVQAACLLFLFVSGNVLLFSYLGSGILEWEVLLYGIGNAACSALAGGWVYKTLSLSIRLAPARRLEEVLREDFPLQLAMRRFSQAGYDYARRVSELSKACAGLVGADPYVAAAGGLYYRIGRMCQAPYVEQGVALAKESRLPREVIKILGECDGKNALPSTVESAVVHMVDSLVSGFDAMEVETFTKGWDQGVLVHQILNESSAAGIYDKSGVSMNMFLKIRDYLIKEAGLF